jgi:hypothetical protein
MAGDAYSYALTRSSGGTAHGIVRMMALMSGIVIGLWAIYCVMSGTPFFHKLSITFIVIGIVSALALPKLRARTEMSKQ